MSSLPRGRARRRPSRGWGPAGPRRAYHSGSCASLCEPDERSAVAHGGQGIWQNGATEEAMKGVVFLGDRKLELREFTDPTPGPRDVILEIKASGMCGSDLHNYRAPANPGGVVTGGIARQAGMIAGHEPCGVVAAVGSAVTEKES